MAEGPVVHDYARRLAGVLEGKQVHVELHLKKLVDVEPTFQNLKIEDVDAHGKQFRLHFSDGRILLVHLMMWGSWRIYRNGVTWDKPATRARVVLRTDSHEVVAFSAPVVKVLTRAELESDPRWGNLGPDPLRKDFSREEYSRRLDEHAADEIGEALLNQRIIAGVGNILKNEILFRSCIHPRRLVSSLSRTEKQAILRWILKLMGDWLDELRGRRRKKWIRIYQKSGKPCPVCTAPIEFFRQAGRITYACSSCQK